MKDEKQNLEMVNPTQQNLEIINPTSLTEMIERSKKQAKELAKLVESNKWSTNIQGKKYLHVEAWETIGLFNGVSAKIVNLTPIKEDTDFGYQAEAELVDRNGNVIGRGYGLCFRSEYSKKNFDKYALAGMAQTRAVSRAFRQVFSPVVVLAGYEPTPEAEMPRKASVGSNKYAKYIELLYKTKKIDKETYEKCLASETEAVKLVKKLKNEKK